MLAKKERFTSVDFSKLKTLKTKRIIVKYGFFVIVVVESASTPGGQRAPRPLEVLSKKAIVLSKKNFKTAVSRNKYKRLFYSSILNIQALEEKNTNTEVGSLGGIKHKSFIFYPNKIFSKKDLMEDLLRL